VDGGPPVGGRPGIRPAQPVRAVAVTNAASTTGWFGASWREAARLAVQGCVSRRACRLITFFERLRDCRHGQCSARSCIRPPLQGADRPLTGCLDSCGSDLCIRDELLPAGRPRLDGVGQIYSSVDLDTTSANTSSSDHWPAPHQRRRVVGRGLLTDPRSGGLRGPDVCGARGSRPR